MSQSNKDNRKFELTPKQALVFTNPATFICAGGQVGGGKSYLLRVYAITVAMNIPKAQVYLGRLSYKELISNHIDGQGGFLDMLAPFIEAKMVNINMTELKIKFNNGSNISLIYGDMSPQKFRSKYIGGEPTVLLIDEATQWDEENLRFLISRVRVAGLKIPPQFKRLVPKVIFATNPGGRSHQFIKRIFIDPEPPMTVFRLNNDDAGGMYQCYIPFGLDDNPHMQNKEGYRNQVKMLGDPDLIKAYLEGDWNLSDGIFFPMFNFDTHVLSPFELPKDNVVVSRNYDYGSAKPYSVLYLAHVKEPFEHNGRYFSTGSIIVVGEIFGGDESKTNTGLYHTINQQAAIIKEFEQRDTFKAIWPYDVADGIADSAIFSFNNAMSLADEFRGEGINFVASKKGGGSIAAGLDTIKQMLLNAGDYHRSLEYPSLYFFEPCWNIINIVRTIERDKKNRDKVDNNASVNDHALDALRYGLEFQGHQWDTRTIVL